MKLVDYVAVNLAVLFALEFFLFGNWNSLVFGLPLLIGFAIRTVDSLSTDTVEFVGGLQ